MQEPFNYLEPLSFLSSDNNSKNHKNLIFERYFALPIHRVVDDDLDKSSTMENLWWNSVQGRRKKATQPALGLVSIFLHCKGPSINYVVFSRGGGGSKNTDFTQ